MDWDHDADISAHIGGTFVQLLCIPQLRTHVFTHDREGRVKVLGSLFLYSEPGKIGCNHAQSGCPQFTVNEEQARHTQCLARHADIEQHLGDYFLDLVFCFTELNRLLSATPLLVSFDHGRQHRAKYGPGEDPSNTSQSTATT
jgi:hypothetical protein